MPDLPARRNATWDAVVAAIGWQPERGDKAAASRIGKCVKALDAVEATPAEIDLRAARYRLRFAGCMLTPEAFVKHWSSLGTGPAPTSLLSRSTRDAMAIMESDLDS
jgi:hypothetical protein